MLVEMVRGLALDPVSNIPVIICETRDKRSLPIWWGSRASAIALARVGTAPATMIIKNIRSRSRSGSPDRRHRSPRPPSRSPLPLGAEYGRLPAVRRRAGASVAAIFVDETCSHKMEVTKEGEPMKTDDPEQLRDWLQNIKPEDFEKFNKA
jgi:hypothetical protein